MNQPFEDRRRSPCASLVRSRLLVVIFAALLLLAAGLLYHFPPTATSLYPGCWFHRLTGLHCPGCGATRCTAALLHGEFAQAAAYNVLLVLYLPLVALGALNTAWRAVLGRPAVRWRWPRWLVLATVVVIVLFWILRNLPFAPFIWLAPHTL